MAEIQPRYSRDRASRKTTAASELGIPLARRSSSCSGFISATSRLYLGYISATSRLYLGYISATSRLHLGYISAISRKAHRCRPRPRRRRASCGWARLPPRRRARAVASARRVPRCSAFCLSCCASRAAWAADAAACPARYFSCSSRRRAFRSAALDPTSALGLPDRRSTT